MAEDYNESTRVMPAAGEPPIDRTMVATAPPPAGATQMGGTLACPVCRTTNPGLETYCVECGFLLISSPGAVSEAAEPEGEAVVLVESSSGRRFRLRTGVNTVGRENCDILLLDGTVSRRHAEVMLEDGSVAVTDLESTNGTQVDGTRLAPNQPMPIRPGTVIRFGNVTIALPGISDSGPAEATIVVGTDGFDRTIVSDGGLAAASVDDSERSASESVAGAVARMKGSSGVPDIFFQAGTLTIGRRPGNDIVLPDSFVSGQHAEVICDDTGCRLSDLGSTNGTTVNGVRLEANQPQLLVDGDEVQIGQSSYRFEMLQSAEESEEEVEEEERTDEGETSMAGEEDVVE